MYMFVSHYINVISGKKRNEIIEFGDNFCDTEKECYLLAMSVAYDKMNKKTEIFDKLEFIAC